MYKFKKNHKTLKSERLFFMQLSICQGLTIDLQGLNTNSVRALASIMEYAGRAIALLNAMFT